jgi:hypothetical protein
VGRLISLAILAAAPVAQAVPLELSHQVRLSGPDGSPLDGSGSGVVALYQSASGSDLIWSETQTVTFEDGFSTVRLGANPGNALTAAMLDHPEVWVQLTWLGNPLVPRTRLGSAPYAVRAGTADVLPATSTCDDGDVLKYSASLGRFDCAPAAPASASRVVNVTTHVSNTRASVPDFSSRVFETISVTKVSATSYLLIQGTISGKGNYSGDLQQGWKFGTAPEVMAQSVMYDENNHSKIFSTSARIDTNLTGTHNLVFRYFTNASGSGERPFVIYNPNSSDDNGANRLAQTQSVYTIWEIEPGT